MGNRHPSIAPYDTFTAADGDFVLAVGNDEQFQRLSRALARPELGADPRFATNADRVRNNAALREALAPLLAARTRQDLLEALKAAGVPAGAVRSVTEALADPQVAAREMIVPLEHLTAARSGARHAAEAVGDARAIRTPPPDAGPAHRRSCERLGLSRRRLSPANGRPW
jgi:crotonobetainyl-CoA:carnitine CoA-transferase CaiB-like acyl-CoA transferase